MKVCWLCNYFSPYAMKHMELIAKHKDIELIALMLGGKDANRNDEWNNNAISFDVQIINKDFDQRIKKIAKEYDVLIDSMYSTIYGIKAVNAFKKYNKITIMQADGGIPYNRGFVINKIMSILMKRHNFFLSSSEFVDKYFCYYGVDSKRIYHYRFTSLTEKDLKDNKKLSTKKEEFRKELGIDNKYTFISVGQPIKRKGFDILLNAYIRSELANKANLYIIGGNPQEEIKEIVSSSKLNNVHFVGLLNSQELKKYYAASDAFILCTREDIWGLVIQEAMSFGLPIITSDNCVAGLHFANLNNNTVICGVNDVKEYAKSMNKLFKENNNELKTKSFETIQEYSIENSAEDVACVLQKLANRSML